MPKISTDVLFNAVAHPSSKPFIYGNLGPFIHLFLEIDHKAVSSVNSNSPDQRMTKTKQLHYFTMDCGCFIS